MFLNFLALVVLSLAPLSATQNPPREKLLHHFSGEWVARGVYTVTKLGVADHLDQPRSVDELAVLTTANPESLYRIMHMLAGFEIFEEISPRIFTNTAASALLMKASPDSLHHLSLFYGEEIHSSWDEIYQSVQTGTPAFQLKYNQPVFQYFKSHPERAHLFQNAMREKSAAVAKTAINSYDFSQYQTICDIGGGQGQFMRTLLHAYPQLTGLVFELPEVVNAAKKESSPLQFIAGDFFISVPKGNDAYLLKSVLHDWDDEKAVQILKNCHQAMKDESRLLIVEVVLQPKAESLYANCMDVLMLAITGGKERSRADFTEMLDEAGFQIIQLYPTATEFTIIEAIKSRKQSNHACKK